METQMVQDNRRDVHSMTLQHIRQEMWKMQSAADIGRVLIAVRQGLEKMDVPFQDCGINVIDATSDPPSVRFHKMTREGQWADADDTRGSRVVLDIWKKGRQAYRRDLHEEDKRDERQHIEAIFGHPVRSVLDVPFSHGTLAINSAQANAFSRQGRAQMGELAAVLSEGFRRLDDLRALELTEEQLRQAQKMEAIGRLAGGIAHDFNNMLMVILSACESLRKSTAPEDAAQQDIGLIREAGERSARLTQQILAFSRRQVLQPEVLDLNEILRDMHKMLKRLIGERVDLSVKANAVAATVLVDRGQFEQVVLNLALNARDAMPSGGRLVIGTVRAVLDESVARRQQVDEPGDFVVLSVRDTGTGMDASTRRRVFDPFFTTKEPGAGTGLGLSTVYGIVKQSNGHIEVESEMGQGTAIQIFLPYHEAEEQPSFAPGEKTGPHRGTGTILLVEDEDIVRQGVRRVLEESGYVVLEAKDGVEGMQLHGARGGAVDLLITDVVMPRMAGVDLAARVRERSAQVKVLFISGYTDNAIEDQGHGAAFLQKPFAAADLLREVRRMLGDVAPD